MYLVLQDRLVLFSPPSVIAVAYSPAFTMPVPDDSLDLTIIIIAVNGGVDPALQVTIEESDDDENWAENFSMLLEHPLTAMSISGPLFGLSARRYRVRWRFADADEMDPTFTTCILAANVETHHD